jgi:hypothetical protein
MDLIKSHFHPIGIQKLSPTQRRNSIHGKPVRVKHRQHTELMVTHEQHKK